MKEIDVIGLIKKAISEPKKLFISSGIFAVVGVIVALNTPKFYTTEVVLAPEAADISSLSSKLGSFSSMLGLKTGSLMTSEALYPQLYPDIFASTDFLTGLFDVPVQKIDDDKVKTYYEHLTQDGKIPFWDYPKVWLSVLFVKKENTNPKKMDPFRLTRVQIQVCEMLRANITCKIDKKTDVITITVTDNDRLISASIADTVMNRLQQYITMYRTKKARHDLAYMEDLYKQSLNEYLQAQKTYTDIVDANQNAFLYSLKSKIQNLKNDMDLKYQVLSEVTTQVQIAKQRVQERIPAFTVIQGASVPFKPSSMPRLMIVLFFAFLGAVADAMWVLFCRDWYYKTFKEHKE